jgi:arylsulfatase
MRWQWLGLALAASLGLIRFDAEAAPRPHVVVILADDLGYSDIGSYGGEIRTANIDQLAASGVRFTQFYTTPRCSPSRASLLTGLHPHRAGMGHLPDVTGDRPGYRRQLNAQTVTVAEVLRSAGYRSYLSGKWHLTRTLDLPLDGPRASERSWPLGRGFHRFYGTLRGAGSYFNPVSLIRDQTPIEPEAGDYYYTDAITEEAIRFVEDHTAQHRTEPFFLYVAYTAPHWPLHAPAEDIARYEGRYDRGWDAVREERYRRMVSLGILKSEWALSPRDPEVPAWADVEEKAWQARRMQAYAAMVERMDRGIGALIAALARAGVLEDTVVFFLSDNGGCAEELTRGEWWLRRLLRLGLPKETRDGRRVHYGNDPEVMAGGEDTYQSYGRGWANASDTPFRLYKAYAHEGGIATPLVVLWPKGLRVERGGLIHAPGHVVDIAPTIFEVAGAEYPREYQGRAIRPLDGESLLPLLEGSARKRGPLFWEHEGNRAVRAGRWKLVSRWRGPWELYDLDSDRTELNDLADREPARAAELAARYEAWAEQSNVGSWPWVLPIARRLAWAAALAALGVGGLLLALARRRRRRL